MSKVLKVAGTLVLAAVAGGFAASITSAPTSVSSAATVEVINMGKGLGAGVVVQPGYVITANHVVDGATGVRIMRNDGQKVDGIVLWQDKVHDLAGVGFSKSFGTGVSHLACNYSPAVGDQIEAVGNPTGLLFVHSFGRVAALQSAAGGEKNDYWHDFYIGDLTINPGNSGGPVYNASGYVVGLAVGERMQKSTGALPPVLLPYVPTGLSYIVPSNVICGAIEAHKDDDMAKALFTAIGKELGNLHRQLNDIRQKRDVPPAMHPARDDDVSL